MATWQRVSEVDARGVRHVVHVRPDVSSRAERLRDAALLDAIGRRAMSLRVLRTGVTDTVLAAINRDPMPTVAAHQNLANDLAAALREVEPDVPTAVLCSWGVDTEASYHAARRVRPGTVVAGLSAGVLSASLWDDLLYAQLPYHEAGRTCAELVLEELTPDAPHRRVLLAPQAAASGPTTMRS